MLEGNIICVTGGAGFIGSTLAEALVEKNKVVVLDNLRRNRLSGLDCLNHPNLTLMEGDVLNVEDVRRAVAKADYIIHCAGVAGIDTVAKNPVHTMQVNMIGSANVLQAAYEEGHCRRVVCFSTSEVFGPHALESKESDHSVIGAVGQARWTYAVSKLAEEHLAISYYQQHRMPTTVLRPFNIYGPGQVGEGAIKIFIERALVDKPLYIHGHGTQIRAWCYVDDMVNAVMRSLEVPGAVGESFNIGNPRSVETILGLANTIIRLLNSRSAIEFIPALSADIDLRIPSVDKAKGILGFTAEVDLEAGIRRTATHYRNCL